MKIMRVERSKKIRLGFLWPTSLAAALGLSSQIIHAQNCTNPAATPHVCAFDSVKHAQAGTKLKGVLLLDWRNGGHDRGPAQRSMLRLAQKYGFRLDRSESNTYINDSTLRGIDLIVFNNGDQDPIPGSIQLNAVRNFVEVQGKAVLAIHAAGGYVPCPNKDLEVPECRWFARALVTQFNMKNFTAATIFADSVRAGEIPPRATNSAAVPSAQNHGRMHPETRMIFEDLPTNGGSGPLANHPYVWEGLTEVWYNYWIVPRLEGKRLIDGIEYGPVNILLSLDESSVPDNADCKGGSNGCKNQGTFGDRPVSWTRKVGNGLFAYQSAGHTDVFVATRRVGDTTVKDSIVEKYNWRLMKYLARDFVGCMNPESANFNPQASVERLTESDPEFPCISPEVSIQPRLQPIQSGELSYSVLGQTLHLHTQTRNQYQAFLFDAAGVLKWSGFVRNSETASISGLLTGNYFLMTKQRNVAKPGKTYRVTIP